MLILSSDCDFCPVLSVVMPVHNSCKYLRTCLDSVLNQKMRDFELIAIDDASSDDSYKILLDFEEQDSRLKVLRNDVALGAAKTRNKGLELAKGEFIIFLDSDDFFELDFFERMLHAVELNNANIAICDIWLRDERKGREFLFNNNTKSMSSLLRGTFCPEDYNNIIFYGMPFAPFNKLIRRNVLLEKNIRFQDIPNSNDVFFGIMSVIESKKIVYIPKPLVHYRYNTGCQISSNRQKYPLCICQAFYKIKTELIERHLWDRFKILYCDLAVASIFGLAWSLDKPNDLLSYLRGDGKKKLGLENLNCCDFSSIKFYGEYLVLFDNKIKNFHSFCSLLFYSFNVLLLQGKLPVLCVILGKHVISFCRFIKNILTFFK
ncbi:glycosyltransferase family 2 protein [Succinivibrio dextrinosolvens]|uniref:glycosyltransferase family 2 protein n=1 Tax=Succinivibrio dextrinosolvens TaxID=83771 RepID=UPI0019238CBE|nr:glycosyltransferase family 2 protein [Succinivibrio dextrinosolvens]